MPYSSGAAARVAEFTIGCIPYNTIAAPWAYYIPEATFDSMLFALIVWKVLRVYVRERRQTPHLMVVLLRDSLISFGGVLVWVLINLFVWAFGAVRIPREL